LCYYVQRMRTALIALFIALSPAAAAVELCGDYLGPDGKRATFMGDLENGVEMVAEDSAGNVYETCSVEVSDMPMTYNVFCDQRMGTLVVNPTTLTFDMFGENWRPTCPTRA
jgi:hypothetical protein